MTITNMEHSVRARLQNLARSSKQPFQEVFQYYGLERWLYRLSKTPHAGKFLLKGALMLRVWGAADLRPTRDIDLLGHLDNEIPPLIGIVKEACKIAVEDDGLNFDASTVMGERIKVDADYQGVRITFTGFLGNSRIPMQIDIGFGDVVHPSPEEHRYPTLLEYSAPRLRMYPRETLIAEKFEAILSLGTTNSRMKDFFDIWLLSRQFDFDGNVLSQAIARTLANRGTEIESEPVALTEVFTASDMASKQWRAFVRRSGIETAPPNLDEIREPLRQFLLPPASSLLERETFSLFWKAPGPWR